jgi:hypothetical protein
MIQDCRSFGWEGKEADNDDDNLQEREEDKGTMMTATAMVAVGGATPKDNET